MKTNVGFELMHVGSTVSNRSLRLVKSPFKAINPDVTSSIQHAGSAVRMLCTLRSTYSQEYLQWGVSHLYELKIHQTARYRYISVVLRCPGRRRSDGCHPAPWAILHPPGAVHGQVERQDKVRVLARQRKRDRWKVSWITSSRRRQIRNKAETGWMSGQVLTTF